MSPQGQADAALSGLGFSQSKSDQLFQPLTLKNLLSIDVFVSQP
jgi:hypothetical protein